MIEKLLPTAAAYAGAFESAKGLSLLNGDVFDCILAHTAKKNADTIWTENIQHFKEYAFTRKKSPSARC